MEDLASQVQMLGIGLYLALPCPLCGHPYILMGRGKEDEPTTKCPRCGWGKQIPPGAWEWLMGEVQRLAREAIVS